MKSSAEFWSKILKPFSRQPRLQVDRIDRTLNIIPAETGLHTGLTSEYRYFNALTLYHWLSTGRIIQRVSVRSLSGFCIFKVSLSAACSTIVRWSRAGLHTELTSECRHHYILRRFHALPLYRWVSTDRIAQRLSLRSLFGFVFAKCRVILSAACLTNVNCAEREELRHRPS